MVRTKDEIQARIKEFKSAMKCGPNPAMLETYLNGFITGLEWSLGDDYEPPPEP
jgi:hypothetical protein